MLPAMADELTDEELARKIVALLKEQADEGFTPAHQDDPGLDQAAAMIEERLTKPGFLAELVRQATAVGIKLDAKDIAEVFLDVAKIRSRLH